jgi:hypothetical protein
MGHPSVDTYTAATAVAGSSAHMLLVCSWYDTSLHAVSTRASKMLVSVENSCIYRILQCVTQLHVLFGESTRSLVMCSYADYCCLYRLHLATTGALEKLLGTASSCTTVTR